MEKITFKCECITPMFMHGADTDSAELRPASIKGVMRFWWRAINGNLKLPELKEKEANIFGSTDKKSSFDIKIIANKLYDNINNIPKKEKFDIYFSKNKINNSFSIDSFFELIVLFALFGQKGKSKTQGAIKIIEKDNAPYSEKIDIKFIFERLKQLTNNYELVEDKEVIEIKRTRKDYLQVTKIFITDRNILQIILKGSKMIKIAKNLGDYNNAAN